MLLAQAVGQYRRAGPARRPFRPGLDSLLDAALRHRLRRDLSGGYHDTSGRAVDQPSARYAVAEGLIFRPDYCDDYRRQTWILTAAGHALIKETV